MSYRLLHVLLPATRLSDTIAILEPECEVEGQVSLDDGRVQIQAVVTHRAFDALLDRLERALASEPTAAIIVSPVDALLGAGRPSKAPPPDRPATVLERFFSRNRLSTEELYDDLEDGARLTASYLIFVATSALIAALGMRSGQTAVVIGAMVIAPFLAPAVSMALAATVGDRELGRRALASIVAGATAAFVGTAALGAVIEVDPSVPELAARTVVSQADIALALASGVAGVIAFCRGLSASLVGVMIAVALVPPLAAAGLLVGSGEGALAAGALLLFATNLVGINVAGIATFLFQGLPPRRWRLTGGLLALWIGLLGALAFLIAARL